MRDTKELQASVFGLILIFLGLLLLVSPCFISEGLAQPAATDQQKELTPDAVRDQLRNDHPGATGDFIRIVENDIKFEEGFQKKLESATKKVNDFKKELEKRLEKRKKPKEEDESKDPIQALKNYFKEVGIQYVLNQIAPFLRVDEKGNFYWGPAFHNLPFFSPTFAMNIDTVISILNDFRQRNQEKLAERQKQLAILQAGLSAMPGATRTTTSGTTQTQNVQFSQLIFNVNEDAGKATITVTRNGGSTGPLAVDYRTIDVTATVGKDYYPVSGTLKWSDGDEFPKSFEVTIIDDNEVEKEETIRLELQNPQNPKANVRLGYQWQAELHIIDNDVEQDKPKPPRPPASCKYIIISPQKIEVKPNQTVTFTAIAFFDDGTNRDVTDFALWQPGPGNQYTAPGDLKFDERIKITARFSNCSGSTEINALAPDWSPPMSHASDRTAHATEPPADAHTWFVFCHPDKGEVVYGEHPQIQDKIMAGAFPGPRNAEFWIEQNCPRWRCTTEGACAKGPASGGQWSVICDKKDLHVYSTKSAPDLTRYWIMAQGLLGEPDANFWIQTNCPSGLCTDGGGCAKAGVARKGGKWAVVCDKNTGSVGLTEYPNVVSQWIWVDNLFGEPDARMWVNQNCPSWRCDRDGKCAKADAPRKGGKWAVVCDKNNGSVGLTEYPNVVSQWILAANLFGEPDARLWTNQNCPSWRCDRNGRCLPGNRPLDSASGRPLDLPPDSSNIEDRFIAWGQRRDRQVTDRNAADASRGYGTGLTTFPQGSTTDQTSTTLGGTTSTTGGGTGPTTPTTGGTGSGTSAQGGTTTSPTNTPTGGSGQTGATTFKCKTNNDCWDYYKSKSDPDYLGYYCKKTNGKCIKCPRGQHGKKDGTAACCKDD